MTQKLLIDIGNTRIKWALESDQRLSDHNLFSWRSEGIQAGLKSHWSKLEKPEAVYISNVAGDALAVEINQWCKKNWDLEPTYAKVSVEHNGLKNSYPAPLTLGIDRWLAMIAAWQPRKTNVCILDCGSAVTIDLVAADGQHLGGLIAPGLNLLGRALTDHTHALALAESNDFSLLADNTEDGINSGCYHWFIGGIEHVIGKMQQEFGSKTEQQMSQNVSLEINPEINYIVTGGDAELLQSTLAVNVIHEPDLVLQGLMLDFQ